MEQQLSIKVAVFPVGRLSTHKRFSRRSSRLHWVCFSVHYFHQKKLLDKKVGHHFHFSASNLQSCNYRKCINFLSVSEYEEM